MIHTLCTHQRTVSLHNNAILLAIIHNGALLAEWMQLTESICIIICGMKKETVNKLRFDLLQGLRTQPI